MKKYKPCNISGSFSPSEFSNRGTDPESSAKTIWCGVKKIYTVPAGSIARVMACRTEMFRVLNSARSWLGNGGLVLKINSMSEDSSSSFVVGWSADGTSSEKFPGEAPNNQTPLKTFKDVPVYLNENDYISVYFYASLQNGVSIHDCKIDRGSYFLSFIEERDA